MLLDFAFYFFVFIFGLCLGSFLNVVICRLQTGESFFSDRSYCPHCQKKLAWPDLMPVLSFLLLKGKCRYCQKKISWQYPLVEMATGGLFFIFIFDLGLTICTLGGLLAAIFNLAMVSFLIVIFVYDLKHYLIPDKIIYLAIAASSLYQLFGHWGLFQASGFKFQALKPFLNPFLSALAASSFFGAIVLISREKWMGSGDAYLAFLMGMLLGFPKILVALALAFLLGGLVGSVLLILKKRGLKSRIPFGPFLVTGTLGAMLWGSEIVAWYLNLMGWM